VGLSGVSKQSPNGDFFRKFDSRQFGWTPRFLVIASSMRIVPALISLIVASAGFAQIETAPSEGIRENTPRIHVLRGATIVPSPGEKIENGVIVLRDGLIVSVGGADIEAPENAREWNLNGKTVYAGFIDAATNLGKPTEVSKANTHWNPLVRPERRAAEFEMPGAEKIEALRNLGFSTAQILPDKGIFRGQSAVINLGAKATIVAEDVRHCIAFERAESYPNSLMGGVALVRQALHDATWHRDFSAYLEQNPGTERHEANTALAALEPVISKTQQLLARTEDELDYARWFDIAAEFEIPVPAILGNGYEYRQAELLRDSGATVIVPLNFPKTPPVENPHRVLEIALERLEHWEIAPANPAALANAEIPICLTTRSLEKPKDDFWKHVRLAIGQGLSAAAALSALTETPAALTGLGDQLGTIEAGKIANLVVAEGDLFTAEDAEIHAIWIDGEPFETDAAKRIDPAGEWKLEWTGVEAAESWIVSGEPGSPKLKADETEFPIKLEGETVLIFPAAEFFGSDSEGTARLSGSIDVQAATARGSGVLPGGATFSWSAKISPASDDEAEEEELEEEQLEIAQFTKYPAGAFGISDQPDQPAVLVIKNGTVWTSAAAGRLESTDLLIESGKITKIGADLAVPTGATVIDADGKHVSPGLIDCHSHSAISRGINESTHAVTVECRIGDVIDPTDIALYRELGGGLTTASVLHGSANPMGGQNQVIKLRWGSDAEGLRFAGAKPGVKFALGENVKQSNWDKRTNRYPQTRMGVEQIMKDTFVAAREYERARVESEQIGKPHRRNLRLEAALEILERERIVHIHSYRQDEVLMFVRLAQEFNFTVGTFQHILEGYKVADALAEIGAGGSSFSDWWAYKFEVYDAIPYNGALLHQAGVVTSFNSDSNELATRLNTEAAKAIKYGGLSEEEAFKFVTINPAIQLRIDDRVGSLEIGKDADFVIWSANPLSSYARAEQTWIDGRRYFDLEADARLRETALTERERLIAKALPKRMTALQKKEADDDDTEEKGKPKMPWFLIRDRQQRCVNASHSLYHNGFDSYTCSSSCCGLR
jgi:imidazolonepropionase-like amidohydrolase